jgi:nucleotide-binding universal stress UspA family protein
METEVDNHRLLDTKPQRQEAKSLTHHGGIGRILVCLDHSSFSDAALREAISIAKTFDSAVTLLYVLQPAHETAVLHTTDAFSWEIARKEAGAYLEQLQAETAQASGLQVDWRLEQGHPAERILSLARELPADLIVLGSHGASGAREWGLGSTAQQVLSVARASVLVARGAGGHAQQDEATPKRILLPLDGSLRAEIVLPTAARIARAHGAEVLLVHVVAEPCRTAMLHVGDELDRARQVATSLESSAARYLDDLCSQLGREGLAVRAIVLRRADERQSLLDLVLAEGVDRVVLSAHGNTCNPAQSFGSVSTHMLAHASVPILVLQDLPEVQTDRARELSEKDMAPELRASFTEGQA